MTSTWATRRVAVAGDWHGNTRWGLACVDAVADAGCKEILHLGDFGYWDEMSYVHALSARLREHEMKLLFIDGNHEHHDALDCLPRTAQGFGIVSDVIRHARRGCRWEIDGVRFGALGGAGSFDRLARTPGFDWFPQEQITEGDVDRLGDEPLDVLLTHDCPFELQLAGYGRPSPELQRSLDAPRRWISMAVESTKPRLLMHGHWHRRASNELEVGGHQLQIESLDCDGVDGNVMLLDLGSLAITDLSVLK